MFPNVDREARFVIGLILIAYAIPIGFAPAGIGSVGSVLSRLPLLLLDPARSTF